MNGLHKLKKWYSLEEAAKRLSVSFGYETTVKDILQFMIEGQIGIYWYLRRDCFLPIELYEKSLTDGYRYDREKLIFDSGIFEVLHSHGEASKIKNKLWDYYFSENKFLPLSPRPTWLRDSQGNVVVLMRSNPISKDSLEQYQKEIFAVEQGLNIDDEWVLPIETDPDHHYLVASRDLPKISEIIVTPEALDALEKSASCSGVAGPSKSYPNVRDVYQGDEEKKQQDQSVPRTESEIAEMREYRRTHTAKETGEKFGISRQRVQQILKTKTEASLPTANNPWATSPRKR